MGVQQDDKTKPVYEKGRDHPRVGQLDRCMWGGFLKGGIIISCGRSFVFRTPTKTEKNLGSE